MKRTLYLVGLLLFAISSSPSKVSAEIDFISSTTLPLKYIDCFKGATTIPSNVPEQISFLPNNEMAPQSIIDIEDIHKSILPPAVGDIIISEILNISLLPFGEWFEVCNTTASDIDLLNWTFFNDFTGDSFTVNSSVIVPAGGYAALAASGDPAMNGGFIPAYVYGSGFPLDDFAGNISVFDENFFFIDDVTWLSSTFPSGFGYSIALDPDSGHHEANDSGDNWCVSDDTELSPGICGTPGAENDTCVDPIITIMTAPEIGCDDCPCDDEERSGSQGGAFGG